MSQDVKLDIGNQYGSAFCNLNKTKLLSLMAKGMAYETPRGDIKGEEAYQKLWWSWWEMVSDKSSLILIGVVVLRTGAINVKLSIGGMQVKDRLWLNDNNKVVTVVRDVGEESMPSTLERQLEVETTKLQQQLLASRPRTRNARGLLQNATLKLGAARRFCGPRLAHQQDVVLEIEELKRDFEEKEKLWEKVIQKKDQQQTLTLAREQAHVTMLRGKVEKMYREMESLVIKCSSRSQNMAAPLAATYYSNLQLSSLANQSVNKQAPPAQHSDKEIMKFKMKLQEEMKHFMIPGNRISDDQDYSDSDSQTSLTDHRHVPSRIDITISRELRKSRPPPPANLKIPSPPHSSNTLGNDEVIVNKSVLVELDELRSASVQLKHEVLDAHKQAGFRRKYSNFNRVPRIMKTEVDVDAEDDNGSSFGKSFPIVVNNKMVRSVSVVQRKSMCEIERKPSRGKIPVTKRFGEDSAFKQKIRKLSEFDLKCIPQVTEVEREDTRESPHLSVFNESPAGSPLHDPIFGDFVRKQEKEDDTKCSTLKVLKDILNTVASLSKRTRQFKDQIAVAMSGDKTPETLVERDACRLRILEKILKEDQNSESTAVGKMLQSVLEDLLQTEGKTTADVAVQTVPNKVHILQRNKNMKNESPERKRQSVSKKKAPATRLARFREQRNTLQEMIGVPKIQQNGESVTESQHLPSDKQSGDILNDQSQGDDLKSWKDESSPLPGDNKNKETTDESNKAAEGNTNNQPSETNRKQNNNLITTSDEYQDEPPSSSIRKAVIQFCYVCGDGPFIHNRPLKCEDCSETSILTKRKSGYAIRRLIQLDRKACKAKDMFDMFRKPVKETSRGNPIENQPNENQEILPPLVGMQNGKGFATQQHEIVLDFETYTAIQNTMGIVSLQKLRCLPIMSATPPNIIIAAAARDVLHNQNFCDPDSITLEEFSQFSYELRRRLQELPS